MMRRRLLFGLLFVSAAISAQAQSPTEYDVKAVFLYNFAQFAQWPDEQDEEGPLRICVLGEAPFGDAFAEVIGRPVRKRSVEVRFLDKVTPADTCHVLFVATEGQQMEGALRQVAGRPILTVGEGEDFVRAGGSIGFVIRNRKVRFVVNPAAAEAAGIRLSSRLLRVAEIYTERD